MPLPARGELGAPEPSAALDGEAFRRFAERSRDGILIIDEHARVVVWNRAEEQLTGIERGETLGRPLWEVQARLVPAELRASDFEEAARAKILKGLSEGAALQRVLEEEIERPDGARIVVQSLLFAIDIGGRSFACGICRDVTDRRRAELALREQNAALGAELKRRAAEQDRSAAELRRVAAEMSRAEERERRRIAAVLHDDLQQQVAGARYHLGVLRHLLPDDPTQQAIAGLVDGLLDEAMEKARSLAHELSPVVRDQNDLTEVLRWLAGQMRTNSGLEVAIDAARPVRLESQPLADFLCRAVRELLFNVVKHAAASAARVRVRTLGRYVGVSVSDRGRGFGDPGASASGMGLVRIQERVEQFGGRLSVRSHRGAGSTVHIVVPDEP